MEPKCYIFDVILYFQVSTFTTGISLFSVVARDEDSGRNGEISYSIVSSQRTGLFRIDSQTDEFEGYICP